MYLTEKQATDRNLIRYLAGQVISSPIVSLKKLGGQMGYNYELNHHHIFKLPSKKTSPDDWLGQSRYMSTLQEYLTFQVPIPQVKMVYSPDKKEFISSLYEKIEGFCISDTFTFAQKDKKFKINFFEQLSDIAYQFHQIPSEKLPFLLRTKPEILENYFFRCLGDKGTDFQKKIFRKLLNNSVFGLGESAQKIFGLSHSDLHCGNIVLNDENKIVGIIDFDTFGRGAPFWEFRPNLYIDSSDIQLFLQIYSQRTQNKINPKDIHNMSQCFSSLKILCLMYSLYNTLSHRHRQIKERILPKTFFARDKGI